MNLYRLSFFLRVDGVVRGATTEILASCATEALLTCESLEWPGPIVGPISWSLTGPKLRQEFRPEPVEGRAA
jgi:hypothetical protein